MPSVEENPLESLENVKTHALLPFLHQQSATALSRLYTSPSSCLSIFRLLTPVERQIVMNILWLESAIPLSTMAAWVTIDGKKLYERSLETLSQLHILSQYPMKLLLNSTFKSSLRHAITGGGTTGSFGVPATKDPKHSPPTVESLDGYALERWETILHYMVSSGTGQLPTKPSTGVLYLLKESGLMSGSQNFEPQITSEGFQFLLHSPHDQLWELLLQYLHMVERRSMDLVEVISFLLMLSTMELGREYSTENLSQTQKVMLEDLRDYGLIWQRRPSSKRFSPTRLATTLTSSSEGSSLSTLAPTQATGLGNSSSNALTRSKGTGAGIGGGAAGGGAGSGNQQGFIILETNYRVYAYTDNPLQTAVLNLFVSLKYRFPNLVVGSITRESVKKALNNGISSEQIISYLLTHAHPQMRKFNPMIPVTVQDQIRLWELEKNRLKSDSGFLYTSFQSQADYEYVLNYAKELGVVLWENNAKRCFFAHEEGHGNIKSFIERRRTAGQGQ
ncbi:transcription factor Tfb2 [Dendrothele bispora CBS 962.96]|uniref:RNA polymerase II transcription factor B subunit 2 n=1 Tax=Dendrothele bispora (strain CBS 962.96) TaxID=1314807 RepID=A0A4V4HEZ5_DENBC|nr:transcription factor Tfb2 [Dendrothele bispora CBS 962.96]